MPQYYLLVKNASDELVAFINTFPINDVLIKRELPFLDHVNNELNQAMLKRPGIFMKKDADNKKGTPFLRMVSLIHPNYRSEARAKGIYRIMLEACQAAYKAPFSISSVHPKNIPSNAANINIGAERIGLNSQNHNLYVLDFDRYIRRGELKPEIVLYPIVDESGNYENLSIPTTHTKENNMLYCVDFPAAIGTPVRATKAGEIMDIVQEHLDFETAIPVDQAQNVNYVQVLADDGTIQEYVHIKQNSCSKQVGDRVKLGENFCKVGNNGTSSEPHLHYGLFSKEGINVPVAFTDEV